MVEISKRDKETTESLIKRFTRQVQNSGILPKARKGRFLFKDKSKRQKKEEAKYKEVVRTEVDKYKKKGLFDENKLKDIKKRIRK